MTRILVCRPDYFDVAYEINPWMSVARPPDAEVAKAQWRGLMDLLAGALGVALEVMEPVVEQPDLVFTANAGLVDGERVVLSNFRHPERQGEAAHFQRWFERHGLEVIELPADVHFEGAGDALFVGEHLFAGYHYRSDIRSHELVSEALGRRVLSLQLADPRFYHLDTCFCPLDAETVAVYAPAFDRYALRVIREHVPGVVEVDDSDALRFACNAVVVDREVAMNTGCPGLEAKLREMGFTPHATPLDQFIRAGGSAKCLTLTLPP